MRIGSFYTHLKYTMCFAIASETFKVIFFPRIIVLVLENYYYSDGWQWLVCGETGYLKIVVSNSNAGRSQVGDIQDWVCGG